VTWLEGSDELLVTASALRAQLTVALAGRAGEELLLGHDVTAGAADDFRKATELARRLVTELGLSSVGEGFFERGGVWSEELANEAVTAIRAELTNAKKRASALLVAQREFFDSLVVELLEAETVPRERITALAASHGINLSS
jgi:cell division protease FtsH